MVKIPGVKNIEDFRTANQPKWVKPIIIIGIVIIILFLLLSTFFIRIPIGYLGVRTHNLGIFGTKGVVDKDFGPGFHRSLPLHDNWVLFDSTTQTLELTSNPHFRKRASFFLSQMDMGQLQSESAPQIEIITKEGYNVSVDITLKYKVKKGYVNKLLRDFGPGRAYKVKVQNTTLDICRRVFGSMVVEEFYNPDIKRQKTTYAMELLGEELKKRYIELTEILIRNLSFDPNYEAKIQDKKLADQDIQLNKSYGIAAEYKGITDKILAETEAMVKVIHQQKTATMLEMEAEAYKQVVQITADYNKYSAEKKAEANLYLNKKQAEGTLLIKKAEATGERLRTSAMSGKGAQAIVALEAAKNINFQHFTLSSIQLNPLDLDSIADLLMSEKDSSKKN